MHGAPLSALDLVQHGLTGDAEALCGLVEREVPVRDVGHEPSAGQISSVSKIRHGALRVTRSPGSNPSVKAE